MVFSTKDPVLIEVLRQEKVTTNVNVHESVLSRKLVFSTSN